MAYVYIHTRLDKNEVFYVGIGDTPNHRRAYQVGKRNKHWHSITSKTGYLVTIVYDDISWEDACTKERQLIEKYGRVDLKTGTLCNWTNGGEGSNGAIVSDDTKAKISLGKTGKKRPPISKESRQKMSLALKGKTPANFSSLHSGNINKKRIENIKGSFSEKTVLARANRWVGSQNPRTTEVLNVENGIYYSNLQDAWTASGLNISRSFFSMMLLGTRKNYTSYKSLFNHS
jgi:hypothetical protein